MAYKAVLFFFFFNSILLKIHNGPAMKVEPRRDVCPISRTISKDKDVCPISRTASRCLSFLQLFECLVIFQPVNDASLCHTQKEEAPACVNYFLHLSYFFLHVIFRFYNFTPQILVL